MPIARVQLEDGRIARFEVPEGATPEQVTAFAQQQFASPPPDQYSVAQDSAAGKIMGALDNVEATPYIGPVVKGVRDVTRGGAQLIAHGVNAVAPSLISDEDVRNADNDLRVSEQKYQQARQANNDGRAGIDWGRMVGSAAVTYPIVPLKAATIPATIGKSAAIGGTLGALSPVTSNENFAADKAKQVGIGALTGGATAGLLAGLSRVIRPNTAPEVKSLIEQGVTPTPGQIMGGAVARFEDKMTSVPVVGDAIISGQRRAINDFNRAAYNRALEPIGKKAGDDVGRVGVEGVRATLGNAYDNLLPKLQFKADQQFATDLNNLTSMASSMPEPQSKLFEKVVRDKLVSRLGPQGTMDGLTFKGVESELKRIAQGYKADGSFDNRQLGDAVGELLVSVRQALQRSNPQQANKLAKINEGFANYARIRDAASRTGAAEGVFTPAQLQAAVRAADKSVGKGQFATGKALMQDLGEAGKTVIGSKYPDSGTAGRLMAGLNPLWAIGLSPAALPYTALGQKATAGLLTKRPDVAEPIARGLLSASPLLGTATAGGLLGFYGPSAP